VGPGYSLSAQMTELVPVLVPVDHRKRSKRVEEDRSGDSAQISENARKACSVVGLRRRLDGTLNQRVAGSIPARPIKQIAALRDQTGRRRGQDRVAACKLLAALASRSAKIARFDPLIPPQARSSLTDSGQGYPQTAARRSGSPLNSKGNAPEARSLRGPFE
jgi:hypothetical protein